MIVDNSFGPNIKSQFRVRGTPISKFQLLPIPATRTSLRGLLSPTLACGSSDIPVEGHHSFEARVIPA